MTRLFTLDLTAEHTAETLEQAITQAHIGKHISASAVYFVRIECNELVHVDLASAGWGGVVLGFYAQGGSALLDCLKFVVGVD